MRPVLRRGQPYRSLDTIRTPHYRTGEPFVEISQANVGLIRRDLLHQEMARGMLAGFTSKELFGMCERAAGFFAEASLPLFTSPGAIPMPLVALVARSQAFYGE